MADDQLTAATRQYLTKVPPWILRGVDLSKLKVIHAPDNTGDNAIASIDTKNPNVIRVHNVAAYMAPGAGPQTLAHELTHVQQTKVVGGMGAFAPVNHADPNSYDANNIDKRKVTDYSPEQLASMNQHYTADQTNPKLTQAQQDASKAQYMKIMQAQANMPMAPINPDQSGQSSSIFNPTINTAPQPPMAQPDYGIMPLPSDQVVPQNSQPAAGQWEDVPQGGSQGSPGDWEDVPAAAPQTYMQGVNQSAGEVLKGAAKQGLQLIAGDPSVAAMTPEARVGQLKNDQELNADTQSSNPAQTAGKVAAGASLLTAVGGEALTNGVRKLTQSVRGGGLGKLLDSNISGALHTDLGQQLSNVAQEAGVDVKPTSDVRKLIGNVGDAIRAKAQSKMDELDELFKGLSTDDEPQGVQHYSDIQTAIDKKQQELAMHRSSTPAPPSATTATGDAMSSAEKAAAKETQIKQQLSALKTQKQVADDALNAQGLGGAREEADRLFKQADDLDALRKAHAKSTFGPSGAGQTNPVKFHEQVAPLHDSGQLSSAMGNEDNAQQLMNSTGEASRLLARNAKVRTAVKYGAAAAGLHEAGRFIP